MSDQSQQSTTSRRITAILAAVSADSAAILAASVLSGFHIAGTTWDT
ncbi:hypothetical protein LINGRAHAP2_LOCUS34386 [Linum grandiflorum]